MLIVDYLVTHAFRRENQERLDVRKRKAGLCLQPTLQMLLSSRWQSNRARVKLRYASIYVVLFLALTTLTNIVKWAYNCMVLKLLSISSINSIPLIRPALERHPLKPRPLFRHLLRSEQTDS